jgi:4-hydroxy-2-oxoheptanedioate aldolase
VIVTLPILGKDAAAMRANYWVAQQVMAAGVHGILLCHAENPEAVKIFVESLRYPFAPKHAGLDTGIRGNGSQNFASQIWGLPANEYMRKADVWPLNKEGEVLLGLKIETPMAAANSEKTTRVPGIGFAEWGPGDQSFFLIGAPTDNRGVRENHPEMQKVRSRIFKAVKSANLFFLNACNESNVVDMIKEGVMICTGGDTPAAEKGRQFTKRQGPW